MADPTDPMQLGARILAKFPFPKENPVTAPEEQREKIISNPERSETNEEVAHWIPPYFERTWRTELSSWSTSSYAWTPGVNVWTRGVNSWIRDSKSWSCDANSRMNGENFSLNVGHTSANGKHTYFSREYTCPYDDCRFSYDEYQWSNGEYNQWSKGENECQSFANSWTHIEKLYLDSENTSIKLRNTLSNGVNSYMREYR